MNTNISDCTACLLCCLTRVLKIERGRNVGYLMQINELRNRVKTLFIFPYFLHVIKVLTVVGILLNKFKSGEPRCF